MRRNYWLGMAALVLLLALSHLSSGQVATQRGGAEAQAWEYRVLLMSDVARPRTDDEEQVRAIEAKFNELGRDGWEFSQIHLKVAVFRRPKG